MNDSNFKYILKNIRPLPFNIPSKIGRNDISQIKNNIDRIKKRKPDRRPGFSICWVGTNHNAGYIPQTNIMGVKRNKKENYIFIYTVIKNAPHIHHIKTIH